MNILVHCSLPNAAISENGPASSYGPVTVGAFNLGDVLQAGQASDGGDLVSEYLEENMQ